MSNGKDKRVKGTHDRPDRHEELSHLILEETDRGFAILVAQHFSDKLEEMIRLLLDKTASRKKVVNGLFSGYGPLSTFSAKIDLLYAMGILDDEFYKQVQLVRKIRNIFAHLAGPVSFADPRVRSLLMQMDGMSAKDDRIEGLLTTRVRGRRREFDKKELAQRTAFALSTSETRGLLSFKLMLFRHIASQQEGIWEAFLRGHRKEFRRFLDEKLYQQGDAYKNTKTK